MPRSIWNGTIAFGLIAVPVRLYSATEDRTVHFHQVHARDGARIKQKRICTKEHREVPYDEVAMGYEVRPGEYVLLDKKEIDAAAGERSHSIMLEEFVRADEIDPVFFERAYYLASGGDAYRLLHDALARSGRAGLGRWVFHNREYLTCVRPLDGILALHTMRFAEELIPAERLELPAPQRKPTRQEIAMAGQLVDSLHSAFRPSSFKDSYRERVLELIAAKSRGEKLELPPIEAPAKTPDLTEALKASLERAADGARTRTGSRSPALRHRSVTT